jgi:hypothetical protein
VPWTAGAAAGYACVVHVYAVAAAAVVAVLTMTWL